MPRCPSTIAPPRPTSRSAKPSHEAGWPGGTASIAIAWCSRSFPVTRASSTSAPARWCCSKSVANGGRRAGRSRSTGTENAVIARRYRFPSILAEASRLPVATASFDIAVLNNMLEHVDDPGAVLSEAHRVLRPGGTAIVLVPHEDNFRRARTLLGRREEAGLDYGHVQVWTPASLDLALRVAGLTPRRRRSLPLPLWPLALHHLALATKPPV